MAGEHEFREAVAGKCGDFEHLTSGCWHFAGQETRPVPDADHARSIALADVVDAEQARDLDLSPNLFATLADSRIGRVLVVVDVASGQTPQTVPGLDCSAADDHLPIAVFDHDQSHHLGVMPEHKTAVGAAFHVAALDRPRLECGTAVHAVMTHRIDGRHIGGRYTRYLNGDNGERPGTRSFRRLAARRRVDYSAKDHHPGRPERLRRP